MTDPETLSPTQAAALLHRQQALQTEADTVLTELNLIPILTSVGDVRQVGSSVLGLMVWRDIDLGVSSPHLSVERSYEIMQPVYTHPHVKHIRYFNESGTFNPTGQPRHDRYFFMVFYHTPSGHEWKIDLSFWLAEGGHPEPVHDALEQQLTPETRLAILWIKDIWHQLPSYRNGIYSVDIYDAVLHHGVRTPSEFDDYLVQRDKPVRPKGAHIP